MKINTRFRYAMRAVLDIASQEDGPVSHSRIASSQEISPKYLERILHLLLEAGILTSQRGVHGGYHLARGPGEITAYDIFAAVEGPLLLHDCVSCPDTCTRARVCATRVLWKETGDRIRTAWQRTTIQDLVRKQGELVTLFNSRANTPQPEA